MSILTPEFVAIAELPPQAMGRRCELCISAGVKFGRKSIIMAYTTEYLFTVCDTTIKNKKFFFLGISEHLILVRYGTRRPLSFL